MVNLFFDFENIKFNFKIQLPRLKSNCVQLSRGETAIRGSISKVQNVNHKRRIQMNKDDLRAYLESQLDMSNQVNQEKVNRYIKLVDVFENLRDAIDDYGYIVETENGSQKFIKPNPALSELNKVSTSINNLERAMKLDKQETDDKPKKKALLDE